jgi:pectin-derived oligosaccharide transport system substrate-binding protein
MKKIVLGCLVLLVGATMVFATGTQQSGAADDVTVRWAYWGGESRIQISQEAIDIYGEQTGVVVNPEPSGGAGDHFVKVDTQIAGGSGPDIIQMGGNIGDYVAKGVLLPLEGYAGTILDTNAIDDSAVQSGTLNGHLYGVSTGVTMPALVYNKSLVERIGAPLPKVSMTYAEFADYLMVLKSKLPAGVYPMQDIGALPTNSTPMGYWSRYNGTPMYDADRNTTDMTASDAQAYLELFRSFREAGLIPPPDIAAGFAEQNADTSAIIAGKVVIGFMWTNQLAGYQGATTDDLGLLEFPGAAATNALWQAPSQFYTVNKDTAIPEETVAFINFLVNSPDAARVLGNDRGASASSTARAAGAENASDQKVLDFLAVAGPHTSAETPHVPNDTELNSTLYLIYQQVAFGQSTAAEGGREIHDLLIRLINK